MTMKKSTWRRSGAALLMLGGLSVLSGCVVVPVPGHGHHRGHGREVVVVPAPQPAPRVIVVPEDRRGHGGRGHHDRRGGRWHDD